MRKRERIELIKKIISENKITTQNDLLARLEHRSGMPLTQATISRDMNELGIVKIPLKDGSYIYSLPKTAPASEESHPITVQEVIKGISAINPELPHFISLSVIPGNGKFLKRRLMDKFAGNVMTIIADDDSVLVVAQTKESANDMRDAISSWLGK